MAHEKRPILAVEDNDDDQFLLREAWKAAGISNPLTIVENGEQACEYLRGAGPYADRDAYPLPALVLLDIKLPGMSGLETLAWLRAQDNLRTLPVIILTASTWPEEVAEAYTHGASSFVIKPSAAQELTDFVAALKNYWLRFNEFTPP
ncbi:MAG: response regulator [Elusimicrobiota bacterium]|nr:response regulator [Elusimicrobiota bacterium]